MSHPGENPLQGTSVELFVIDDQYVRFSQKSISGSKWLAEGGRAAEL
jgi:hypothetical protein